MLHDLNIYIVGRLLLAALLGGLIGLERELSHKPAGLRTNMLICLGSALFAVISYQMAGEFGGDHTRIAAQIIPGIGFIGAGVVIRERGTIIGITSASTIFVVASIGMAVGSGMSMTAIFATLLILASLVILGKIEDRLGLHARVVNFRVTATGTTVSADRVRAIVEELRISIRRWHTHQDETGLTIDFDLELTVQQERDLAARLGGLPARVDSRPVSPITPL
jgi:putative Mg2+ transporter-C (MgtC) family protein